MKQTNVGSLYHVLSHWYTHKLAHQQQCEYCSVVVKFNNNDNELGCMLFIVSNMLPMTETGIFWLTKVLTLLRGINIMFSALRTMVSVTGGWSEWEVSGPNCFPAKWLIFYSGTTKHIGLASALCQQRERAGLMGPSWTQHIREKLLWDLQTAVQDEVVIKPYIVDTESIKWNVIGWAWTVNDHNSIWYQEWTI